MCESYARRDSRVHVIHQENGGLSAARNTGIDWVFASSDSRYLAFVDSDDYIAPEYLQRLFDAAERTGCSISVCGIAKTGGEPLPRTEEEAPLVMEAEDYYCSEEIHGGVTMVAVNKLYDRALFETLRYPKGKLHEDEFTEVAQASSFPVALCVGSIVGGAMFGDNLSFISDTTIAACNGQGCAMRDKFRGNFWIALPAAVATLVLILILTLGHNTTPIVESYNLLQILPYVLVLTGGIAGINVFVVLLIGIVSGAIIMLATGQTAATELLASMGSGAAGMFETSMVAVLVAAMCSLIRVYGGFDALLGFIQSLFKGKKGGQLGMGLLVGAMDIATANNTVAIVMANPIAKEMSQEYGISPQRTACLLDTFSCISQGIIDRKSVV